MVEDLPDVDTVLVPYGGGGLSCGIAAALRALRPEARVFACEVETAAPLSASLAAGAPREVDYRPSFVDGIGGKSVLAEMWPLASALLAGAHVVPLAGVADAIRLLAERNRVDRRRRRSRLRRRRPRRRRSRRTRRLHRLRRQPRRRQARDDPPGRHPVGGGAALDGRDLLSFASGHLRRFFSSAIVNLNS